MNDTHLEDLLKAAFATDTNPTEDLARRLVVAPRNRTRTMLVAALIFASLALMVGAGLYFAHAPASRFDFGNRGQLEIAGLSGEIEIFSPDGKKLGTATSYRSATEPMRVSVDGYSTTIKGVGTHEIRDRSGKVRFILIVTNTVVAGEAKPRSVTEMLKIHESELEKQGQKTISAVAYGVIGRWPPKSLIWKVEGNVRVKFASDGEWLLADSWWPAKGSFEAVGIKEDYAPKQLPVVTWQVGPSVWSTTGYGIHKLSDAKGRTLATLNVTPPRNNFNSDSGNPQGSLGGKN